MKEVNTGNREGNTPRKNKGKKKWYGKKAKASKNVTNKDLELLAKKFNKKHHVE